VGRIKWFVKKRYYSLLRRSEDSGIRPPSDDIIDSIVQMILADGLVCHYCGRDIDLYPSASNFKASMSLDHKIPFSLTKNNSLDNLIVCCTRCNFAKGMSNYSEFKERVNELRQKNRQEMEHFLEVLYNRNRGSLRD
jgi:5-methylcytosine-specific restriction endonuclease McrA